MKKILLMSICCFLASVSFAQQPKQKLFSIAFYNVENLFDTTHDEGKLDADFLPDGKYKWTPMKYENKLTNVSRVLGWLSRDVVPQGPAAIGLAEVENKHVLDDLLKQPSISHYKYVHYEGPDRRGIDCALLYDPSQFNLEGSKYVLSTPYKGDTIHLTRGFLIVRGNVAGEPMHIIVNHWPSRAAKPEVRVHAALQVKALTDSIQRVYKKAKIVVMGDLNDDPMDESVVAFGGKKYPEEVKKMNFYNPWWTTLENGTGTLKYKGKWNLFDQILVSNGLLNARKGLRYETNEVFKRDFLLQQKGKYQGYPLRTHAGRYWLNGYSDHFPTIIYLRLK